MALRLTQDRLLGVSPTLAATIGLEEALLLQLLHDLVQLGGEESAAWHDVDKAMLLHLLPFWQERDCQRVLASLRDRGIIRIESPPLEQAARLRFSFEVEATPAAPARQPPLKATGGKSLIAPRWEPDVEVMRQLALHGVPREFAEGQVDEFALYWSERGDPAYSWNAKFRSHVIRRFREHQSAATAQDEVPRRIEPGWQPGADALEILQRAGVDRGFIEDTVPEFVLYWGERGEASLIWNSRFVTHVKRQWARYTATMDLDGEPRRLPAGWQPSRDVYDILRMANIDADFATALLPEFAMYWTDSGEAHASWNSKFLQHVKYHWARSRSPRGTEQTHENRHGPGPTGSTRHRSLVDDLTDRSWAD